MIEPCIEHNKKYEWKNNLLYLEILLSLFDSCNRCNNKFMIVVKYGVKLEIGLYIYNAFKILNEYTSVAYILVNSYNKNNYDR